MTFELFGTRDSEEISISCTAHSTDTFLVGYDLPSYKWSSPIVATSTYRPIATSTTFATVTPHSHFETRQPTRNHAQIFRPYARCGGWLPHNTSPHRHPARTTLHVFQLRELRQCPLESLVWWQSFVTFLAFCCQGTETATFTSLVAWDSRMSASITVSWFPTHIFPLAARYSFHLIRCKNSRKPCSVRWIF